MSIQTIYKLAFYSILLFQFFVFIAQTLDNQCGIQFCRSCDSSKTPKYCNQCDLPYKPAFNNQSVCARCSNNCLVCKDASNDTKGDCLSCQPNYNFSSDVKCNTFYFRIYAAVIGGYLIFVIAAISIFCILKRNKKKQKSGAYYQLKQKYNRYDENQMSEAKFQDLSDSLLNLLKQASSYRHFKFCQEKSEVPMKIKEIKFIPCKNKKLIKKIIIKGVDNSEWKAKGFIFAYGNSIKFWFLKQYQWRVQTDKISKHIVYESKVIGQNGCQGVWYFYNHEQFNGEWSAKRVSSTQQVLNQIKNQDK